MQRFLDNFRKFCYAQIRNNNDPGGNAMVCNQCGTNVSHDAAYCPKCGKSIRRSGGNTAKEGFFKAVLPWEEKKLRGTLGAVLGSFVGALALFQILQMADSYLYHTLGGLILGLTTIGGYWWLGGRLSTYGKFLTVVLTLVMGFVTQWVLWMLIYLLNIGSADSLLDLIAALADHLYRYPPDTGAFFFGLLFQYEGSVIAMIVTFLIHNRVGKY